jgi:hypothetical protein
VRQHKKKKKLLKRLDKKANENKVKLVFARREDSTSKSILLQFSNLNKVLM